MTPYDIGVKTAYESFGIKTAFPFDFSQVRDRLASGYKPDMGTVSRMREMRGMPPSPAAGGGGGLLDMARERLRTQGPLDPARATQLRQERTMRFGQEAQKAQAEGRSADVDKYRSEAVRTYRGMPEFRQQEKSTLAAR